MPLTDQTSRRIDHPPLSNALDMPARRSMWTAERVEDTYSISSILPYFMSID